MDWGLASGVLFLIFIMGVIAIGVAGTIFWIFMLIDAAQRKFQKEDDRLLWILVIVLTGIVGALVYFFVVKNKRK